MALQINVQEDSTNQRPRRFDLKAPATRHLIPEEPTRTSGCPSCPNAVLQVQPTRTQHAPDCSVVRRTQRPTRYMQSRSQANHSAVLYSRPAPPPIGPPSTPTPRMAHLGGLAKRSSLALTSARAQHSDRVSLENPQSAKNHATTGLHCSTKRAQASGCHAACF
jgi:hypothetical protein